MRIYLNYNVSAIAPIPPIRSPFGDVFLPPEADTTPSPVAGFDHNFRIIDKLHNENEKWGLKPKEPNLMILIN